jgi:hypothetical protein
MRCLAIDALAAEPNLAGIGSLVARDQIDGGRFPSAVRPDQTQDLAGKELEAQLADSLQSAKALGDSIDRQDRIGALARHFGTESALSAVPLRLKLRREARICWPMPSMPLGKNSSTAMMAIPYNKAL